MENRTLGEEFAFYGTLYLPNLLVPLSPAAGESALAKDFLFHVPQSQVAAVDIVSSGIINQTG